MSCYLRTGLYKERLEGGSCVGVFASHDSLGRRLWGDSEGSRSREQASGG